MQIQLINLQYPTLRYDVLSENPDVTQKTRADFTTSSHFDNERHRNFDIVFSLTLENETENFRLAIKAVAHFKTDEPINEEFKTSHFPRINAPAIAYPFIRAFVANLVLSSGYNPIMLPTINFQQRAEDEDKK